jgi:formate hydrogenlyase transcriptional activator
MSKSPGNFELLVARVIEQINMGQGLDELLDSAYDQLSGVVPYNRIAVAPLEQPLNLLRLISCRSEHLHTIARLATETIGWAYCNYP